MNAFFNNPARLSFIIAVLLISLCPAVSFGDDGTILQGGDNFEDACVIEWLPFIDSGTTIGYNLDYENDCGDSLLNGPDVCYSFTPVPGRSYQLVFEKRNYFEQTFPGIVVGVAETLTLDDIYMEPYPGDVNVWYGNPDGSPVTVPINATVFIDLYCQTADSVDLGFLHLPLGTDDRYIVDHFSETLGVLYYPLTEWEEVNFYPPNDYEPGWHSQSLLGFYWTTGSPGPPLHYDEPTRIAAFAFKTANDSSLIGDTVYCFTEGFDPANGGPLMGGTDAVTPYYPVHHFSPLYFSDEAGNCIYTVGDVNRSWSYNGLDITYGVAFFKGGPPPPYECECTQGNTWYVAGDVNASCDFNGLDITYGVVYFKGGPSPQPCPECPPAQ